MTSHTTSLATYSILSSTSTLLFTTFLLRYYSRPGLPRLAWLVVFSSWSLSFTACFVLLPLDLLASTPDAPLLGTWNFVYWTSFIFTWLVIPLLQCYYEAGEFSVLGRLRASARANLRFYAWAGVLLLAFGVYVAVENNFTWHQFLGFFICLSNTWGLLLAVLLLGYGLVEVPRQLWHSGSLHLRLKETHFAAADVFVACEEAVDRVSQVIQAVDDIGELVPRDDPHLLECYDQVAAHTPGRDDVQDANPVGQATDLADLVASARERGTVSEADLALLNYHVKSSVRKLVLARNHWRDIVERSDVLEVLISNEEAGELRVAAAPDTCWGRLLWRYRKSVHPVVCRAASLTTAAMSLLVIWSEMTMSSSANLSPFAVILNEAADHPSLKQFCALLIIGHLCLCAFYGLFQLRLFEYYNMRGNQRTEENSLLFNASYSLRLVPALGYNFVGFVRAEDTEFQHIIGKMDAVPFFGSEFTDYFPIIISLFCLAMALNMYQRFLRLLGITPFEYSSDFSDDTINEGQMYIRKARRQRERSARAGDDSRSSRSTRSTRSSRNRTAPNDPLLDTGGIPLEQL